MLFRLLTKFPPIWLWGFQKVSYFKKWSLSYALLSENKEKGTTFKPKSGISVSDDPHLVFLKRKRMSVRVTLWTIVSSNDKLEHSNQLFFQEHFELANGLRHLVHTLSSNQQLMTLSIKPVKRRNLSMTKSCISTGDHGEPFSCKCHFYHSSFHHSIQTPWNGFQLSSLLTNINKLYLRSSVPLFMYLPTHPHINLLPYISSVFDSIYLVLCVYTKLAVVLRNKKSAINMHNDLYSVGSFSLVELHSQNNCFYIIQSTSNSETT